MPYIYVNINGHEIRAHDGLSILDVATRNGIEIPTLCHDERVKAFGACGICLVEVEGMPRLARACSTAAADGMAVRTDTRRAREARTAALEFMLSDHRGDCRPPCVKACPAQTDCQGYVGLIANGEYKEAAILLKEALPLPASIGRVCPRPCEEACRRELVEAPISIADLKRFAADFDMGAGAGGDAGAGASAGAGDGTGSAYMPDVQPDTGKRVAVIGGGPGGLSAAYFLRRMGHSVAVFDAMPKMGGMLRYGIPEYRLPKAVLDMEISLIEQLGVQMVNGARVGGGGGGGGGGGSGGDVPFGSIQNGGGDVPFGAIRAGYDATVVAIGAWTSVALRCPGEDLPGVVGGIDFLREVALHGIETSHAQLAGRRVAIVGGGNTAMDACRTAVRLGAAEVSNVYRRTKDEMPAEDEEILEAEEEGVVFRYLVNPIEILEVVDAEGGRHVGGIRLQKMRLGEPDQSGRRAPVPIDGDEEMLGVDMVIVAIGQGVDPRGLDGADGADGLALTRRRTVIADEATFLTNIEGVFAIGDATNKGAGIAIEAIGEARRAAGVIDGYLRGAMAPYADPFIVKREMSSEDFADRPKAAREKARRQEPGERKRGFDEVGKGFTPEQARAEAKRCLECGCDDYFECKLVKYARRYDVRLEKFKGGGVHRRPLDVSNPFISRNPEKCILCGLCVRVCDEAMGIAALGFASRGFDTAMQPEFGLPLAETGCISCGQCVAVCPTGALGEALPVAKPVPVAEKATRSVCPFCGVGCGTRLATAGGMLLRSLPDDAVDKAAMLCAKGRFGFTELHGHGHGHAHGGGGHAALARVTQALVRRGGGASGAAVDGGSLEAADLAQAIEAAAKAAQGVISRHGPGALAVAVSDSCTNEEIFMVRRYATEVLGAGGVYCLNGVASGLMDVFGDAAGTNTLDELAHADAIVLFCEDVMRSHTIAGVKIKQAVESGAKLILASNLVTQADEWATAKITPGEGLGALKAMARELVAMGKRPKGAHGFDEFAQSLSGAAAEESAAEACGGPAAEAARTYGDVAEAARIYGGAKRAMFVFDQKALTRDAARLIAGIAAIAGHVGKPRSGVVTLLPGCNTQGMLDMGVNPDGAELVAAIEGGRVKGLLVFGEDLPSINFQNLEFLLVCDSLMTETASRADVVLPRAAAAESDGTYTSMDRKIQLVRQALCPPCGLQNWQIVQGLANAAAQATPGAEEAAPDSAVPAAGAEEAAPDAAAPALDAAAPAAKALRYGDAGQIRRDIGMLAEGYRGFGEHDFEDGAAFVPLGRGRVLHEGGFAFEDGMARLAAPEGDALFTRSPDTNAANSHFMRFMEEMGRA